MTREDYDSLLKITDHAIAMAVGWRKAFVQSGMSFKNPQRLNSVNAFVADLTEFKVELKQILRGEQDSPTNEVLTRLLKEIDESRDPDTRELYLDQLAGLMKKLLAEGRMEVRDAGSK